MLLLVVLVAAITMAACGEETAEDVLADLEKQVGDMESFRATADMTMNTGEEPQHYQVNLWHLKDDYFKVEMNNQTDEKGNQVILRNEEGVFVLTPSINKSYKFQNDWPQHHSQPYLYQSLVNDIQADSEREYQTTENYYVFKVKTDYKGNQQLPLQEIYFHKKSLQPALVRVQDQTGETMVEVDFTEFEFNANISMDEFDTDENLAEGAVSVPTMAELETEENEIYFPTTLPEGTSLVQEESISFDNGERTILTFEGDKSFTLVQEMYESYPTSLEIPVYANGEMVDLGMEVGVMTDQTLEWEQDGMRFVLASDSLTVNEKVDLAKSVMKSMVK